MVAPTANHWVFDHWFKALKTSHLHTAPSAWYYLTVITSSFSVLSSSVLSRLFSLSIRYLSDIYLTVVSYLSDIFDNNNIGQHYCASLMYSSLTLFHFLFISIYPPLCCVHTASSQPWLINLAKPSTDTQAGSSSVASSQDLSCLSDCCVLAAYQLKQFESMNHVYVSLISNNIIDLVHSIITLYSNPPGYQPVKLSKACQTCVNISQSDLDYSISWSLTKSSLIKIIHCFKKNSNSLLNHPAFLMWALFQSVNNPDQFNQSDSFKTEWRLHWFLSSTLNQPDKPESTASSLLQSDQSYEQISSETHSFSSETHPQTSPSVESIPHSSSLSQNMVNNNNDNDIFTVNSIFSETQMQMLQDMIAQTKKDDCAEECAKAANPHYTADLPHCSEQSDQYSDQHNLSWCCQYDFDPDNPDKSDKSASDISDVSWRQLNEDNQFCLKEIGFFNPHLDTKNYSPDDIVDVDEKIYFCDVHLFINFFKNVTHTKADSVVCWNLNKCLCDIVQNWYIGQLSAIECEYIWEGHGVEHWEEMLFQWFKHTQLNAMKMLKTECYIIQNVQNNHEPLGFVFNVICHAKNTNMTNTSTQLMWVWN